MAKLIALLLLNTGVVYSSSDLFSSMSDMEELYQHESTISEQMTRHLKDIESQISMLDTFLDTYYENHNYTEDDAEEYVSHPLNTFSLIKRTAMDWPQVQKRLFGNKTKENLEKMLESLDEHIVTEKELAGAAGGLFLLAFTYNFNLTEMAAGRIRIPEAQTIERDISRNSYIEDSPMTIEELDMMGKLAFNMKHLDKAIEFLQTAESLAIEKNKTELLKDIRFSLNTVIKKHDEFVIKNKGKDEHRSAEIIWTYAKPFDSKLAKRKKFAKIKNLKPKLNTTLYTRDITEKQMLELFEAACRGEELRKPEDDKDLKCKWIHYKNPYLALGPFKLEEKNLQPFVGIFRDFMSDIETNAFKEAANGKLHRSGHSTKQIGGDIDISGATTFKRTSKQIWLSDVETTTTDNNSTQKGFPSYNAEAFRVASRIRNATMMEAYTFFGGEMFQVANYGIGGQYTKHWDAAGEGGPIHEGFDEEGDRIQTFMAYLSDVEAGGATAFPMLGMSIWPKKGDAITWYNMHANGQQDKLMAHGGCPVIKGSKWITNKWIRWYTQALTFPCDIDRRSRKRLKPLANNIHSFLPHGRTNLLSFDKLLTREVRRLKNEH